MKKMLMPKVVKFYSKHFPTLCKQYIPLSVGEQILLDTEVIIGFLCAPTNSSLVMVCSFVSVLFFFLLIELSSIIILHIQILFFCSHQGDTKF